MRTRSVVGTLLAVLMAAATVALPAAPHTVSALPPGFVVTGWVPYWETDGGVSAINNAGSLFTEVSPFWYSATGETSISRVGASTNLAKVVNAAKDLKILPSITDGTGKGAMAAIMADPTRRANHVSSIVNLVNSNGFDGIDIDYEGFAFNDGRDSWAATQPNWLAFIRELGAALGDKALSITVPPIWDDGKSGYWVYGPCVDDEAISTCAPKWAELMPHVDRWRLMVYDWSFSIAGPIAPMYWVDNVISYVKQTVPSNEDGKVQIGVPAYGRSWGRVQSGTCPANADRATRSVLTRNAQKLASDHGVAMVDAPNNGAGVIGEKTFTYTESFTGDRTTPLAPPIYVPPTVRANTIAPADGGGLEPALRLSPNGQTTCVVLRTVYVPDTASIAQRAKRTSDQGLGGITIWALGYETPDVWDALRNTT